MPCVCCSTSHFYLTYFSQISDALISCLEGAVDFIREKYELLYIDIFLKNFIMKIKRNIMEIVLKLRQICILALNMNFNYDVNIGRAYLPRLFSAFHRF